MRHCRIWSDYKEGCNYPSVIKVTIVRSQAILQWGSQHQATKRPTKFRSQKASYDLERGHSNTELVNKFFATCQVTWARWCTSVSVDQRQRERERERVREREEVVSKILTSVSLKPFNSKLIEAFLSLNHQKQLKPGFSEKGFSSFWNNESFHFVIYLKRELKEKRGLENEFSCLKFKM